MGRLVGLGCAGHDSRDRRLGLSYCTGRGCLLDMVSPGCGGLARRS